MGCDRGRKSISHLIEDIEVKLTLRSRAVVSVGDALLAHLLDTSFLHAKKIAVSTDESRGPNSVASTPITHDAERIIELIRMARNADVTHFTRHKQGGLLH